MSAVRRTARRVLAFSQDERRRNELLEQRTRDAEEGRARALQANQQVQQALNLRLRGRVLPQVVVQMLEQAWSQVLLLAWLKQGEASAAWRDGWRRWTCCWPASRRHMSHKLLQQLPGLLKALREGWLAWPWTPRPPVSSSSTWSSCTSAPARPVGCRMRPWGCAGGRIVVHCRRNACVPCTSPTGASAAPGGALAHRRLGRGAGRRRTLRCKLVARIDGSDRLVFANRTGMKVREWSSASLAQALPGPSARSMTGSCSSAHWRPCSRLRQGQGIGSLQSFTCNGVGRRAY
jgi:hypothetical protein